MQAFEKIDECASTPILAVTSAESSNPEAEIHHLRALRRKARRISAYARWSVTALNALAVQVESEIAALQH
ncbi:MAG TPA: hypothetical protein VGH02_11855 [Rhizomicrobium sp.]